MVTKNYRVKISNGGNEFEVEGDKAFVLDMLKRYSPQSGVAIELPGKSGGEVKGASKKGGSVTKPLGKGISIREFIQQFELKKQTDITLAFGYYLEKHAGVQEFSAADINNCYYEAKMENSNTSQMIIQNIKRGYMMSSKNKEEKGGNKYTLTNTGETFVETKLPRNS
ncbi:MAG: hypothetical protein KGI29_06020 [Pseudomonadota bacterium]|nr:hypothetical protein [Pseudomonadota bacterium]MDE3037406.1 hypothetical protein [Pseudomonadota bacterium]